MKHSVTYKILQVSAILLAAVLAAAILLWLKPQPQRQAHRQLAPLIEVMPVVSSDRHMMVEGFGTVIPRHVLELSSEVRGRVVSVHPAFRAGGFVEKNMSLLQIDPATYALEIKRLEAQMEQKKAELSLTRQQIENLRARIRIVTSDVALAKADLNRLETLKQRNVVAQTTVDRTRQQYLAGVERLQTIENQLALTGPQMDQINAGLKTTTVLLEQARLDLERTRIQTPFDGWVLDKIVEQGQYVNPGQYLGRLYKHNALDVEIRIPSDDFEWIRRSIRQNMKPEVEISPSGSTINFARTGRVARVKAQVDEKTRTVSLIVEIDEKPAGGRMDAGSDLKPGTYVKARIKGEKFEHVAELPRYLIHEGGVVYLLEGERLRFRPVHVLRYFKESAIVNQGLTDGDLIVTTPLSGAVDGMEVRRKG